MVVVPQAQPASRLPALVGRRAELDALMGAPSGLVALRGGRGSGRSLVLEHLARRKAADGGLVLHVTAAQSPAWDRFGVTSVLDAVRRRFEDLDADAGVMAALAGVDRACTPVAYTSPDGRSGPLSELCRLLRANPAMTMSCSAPNAVRAAWAQHLVRGGPSSSVSVHLV